MKIVPWKELVQTSIPIAAEEIKKLLEKTGKRKGSDSERLEVELKQTVEALRDAFTELSDRMNTVAEASKIAAARATIALIISIVSVVLTLATGLYVLFHH